MNTRTIKILGGLTVVIAVAAVIVTRDKGSTSAETSARKPLYPGLVDEVNLVGEVRIENPDGSYSLKKKDGEWALAEKGDFSVKIDKVRGIINQVAFADIVEPKTSNPELYSRLQVEDVGAEGALSTRVTLRDESGKTLADLIVGKPNATTDPMAEPTLFVRKAGDAQSFEVTGRLSVGGTDISLLDTQVLKIERERVQRIVTVHPDGEQLELAKGTRDETYWGVVGKPEDRELKYATVTDYVGSALEYVVFEDVQPSGEVDFDVPEAVVTEFETWDGLRVSVRVLPSEEHALAQFHASYDPALRVEPVTVGPPPPDGSEGGTEEGIEDEGPPPEQPLKPAEEVQNEAQELDARLSRWTYKLPGYRASNYQKRMEDMLKEQPKEEPPPPDEPPPSGDPAEPDDPSGGEGGEQGGQGS